MNWKTVSIPKELFEATEKYVEKNFDPMGNTPELKNVPSFIIHILNRELKKLGESYTSSNWWR